ncbi:PEP-utilizing enzyme [Nocardia alni]|uniref:PEP-utilizing enzyme n=1 Tax=Nocardia alni TaxID=2815723 RepID=UPI001C23F1A4|nr:PEP-utilizing enzyme [Nocardia alni]
MTDSVVDPGTTFDIDSPWVVDSTPNSRFPLYTRANVSEVAPNVTAPLFATTVAGWHGESRWRTALINFGVFEESEFRAGDADIMPVFFGYHYLNVSVQRVLGVRSPGVDAHAMDVAFFGENPDVPRYEPRPGDDDPKYEARVKASIDRVLATRARPDLDNDRVAAAEIRRARPDLKRLTDQELVAYFRDITNGPFAHHHEKVYELVHESSIPVAALHAILAAIPDAPPLVSLVSGLGDIDSAEPTRALWELSRAIRRSPALTALFDESTDGLPARLAESTDPEIADLARRFEEFLYDYGSRGINEWDVCTTTWETHPDVPLAMLERMRLQPDDQSPTGHRQRLAEERERATASVRAALAADPAALAAFDGILQATLVYMVARERNKTNAVRVLQEARVAIRELGLRMVDRGWFTAWDDINMLRNDELDALTTDPSAFADVVRARHSWSTALQQLEPPYVVHGSVPPPSTWARKRGDESAVQPTSPGTVLSGLPACPGVATGPARVISDPGDARELQIGEVLIAPMTDPGWTPLFASAAAIVVDVGSQLSHAAIVSRELGIPCVVGLANATKRIRDGASVTVDGNTGQVTIH